MAEHFKTITREELKAKIDHRVKFTLVEVLPKTAFEHAHLPQAINVPVEDLRIIMPRLVPSEWDDIVVYSAGPDCHASRDAARELVAMGYKNVKAYEGGKQDWIEAGFPVESSHRHGEAA